MRKFIMAVALILSVAALAGCGTTVEPGYTGIKINQMGGDKGVSKDNTASGFTFYVPVFQKVVKYPTFNQRVVWTESKQEGAPSNEELTFNTKDQIKVDMDASLNYSISPTSVPQFYTNYRADDISVFTHGFLRDAARNAVTRIGGEYTFEELNGAKKEEFLTRIEESINKVVNPNGVVVKQFSAIGALRPPKAITDAVIEKTASTQKAITAENQLREIKANAAKATAEAQGVADANRIKAASNTPAYAAYKALEIEEIRAKKWNGALPSTMLGGGSNTLFNLAVK